MRSGQQRTVGDVLYNFLVVLNDHERFELLRSIRTLYQELLNERRNLLPVYVTSAVPLTDPQRERLLTLLRQGMQREPLLREQVDPDLLGGLTIRAGDWLYDEFRLNDRGHVLHEIEWSGPGTSGQWMIEASDVEFAWRPYETFAPVQPDA